MAAIVTTAIIVGGLVICTWVICQAVLASIDKDIELCRLRAEEAARRCCGGGV